MSAAISENSRIAALVDHILLHDELICSAELLDEYLSVLSRPKFEQYLSAARRAEIEAAMQAAIAFVVPVEAIDVSRDADDNKVLEAAVSGNAELIVSGDRDLLALHPFRGIPILSPADAGRFTAAGEP